ncbi:MAG: hypothetical protein K2H18_07300, partial [Muribaculaceae bacterium]|nr:hypothetical protein [Muribaculaceae bacterium]
SDNYNLSVYPVLKPSIWNIIVDGGTFEKVASGLMSPDYSAITVDYLRRYLTREKVQARMPDFKVGF